MNTGPMEDHTTGKGYYLYVESSGRRINEKAILVSKVLKPKQGGQCLKFYYTMFGKTMGYLKVQVTQNGVPKNTLFFRRGNQGRVWILGTATLKNLYGDFKLEFIANVGGRGYSDIAIDDVYIDDGECDYDIRRCSNKQNLPMLEYDSTPETGFLIRNDIP
ncbi:MAM and LDL-receptor class A domain-containing protein 2 [Exaiptasia diaphana]|nr:MAM and LDL-receptor class A domain-containing protein 2 [Exaiptasia diaphana]